MPLQSSVSAIIKFASSSRLASSTASRLCRTHHIRSVRPISQVSRLLLRSSKKVARDGSDRAFDRIVVELDTAVVQEMTEGRPAGKGVTDRFGETPAAWNATKLRLEPRPHRLDERP